MEQWHNGIGWNGWYSTLYSTSLSRWWFCPLERIASHHRASAPHRIARQRDLIPARAGRWKGAMYYVQYSTQPYYST